MVCCDLKCEGGPAVLFIPHDFGVVAEIADRVVVLRLGDMIEQGAKLQVLQQPREPYTRMLLAAVPALVPRTRPPVEKAYPLLDACGIGKTYVTGSWPARKRKVQPAMDVSLMV